ncbi:AimR family lysis-lysogeny pheromone receptor [Bacillus horti]|uniref:Transcriptional regulator with XRE-family HTH domain n=1 Tax=Caldalkalibacillus horti TaxID=77523 RepID=A0ABT9VU52_9BACI|nr:AimR family lysis-lysogeny pheromone receptor [Bacillus horti]MDQ0164504.1 transcriptional regulator with XRE-family HTH domain [Bacillus horti]
MLREKIMRTLDNHNTLDQRKLSHIANVTESTISRYLHGHEEMRFESVLRIIKYLYPKEELSIMSEYVMTQRSRNARLSLEYCAIHKLWREFDFLIDLLSSSSTNPTDREWAEIYSLLRLRILDDSYTQEELLLKVEEFKPKDVELKVLKAILKALIYYDMKEVNSILLHNKNTFSLIEDIKSDFLRSSFSVRLGIILSVVHLYSNKLEQSRQASYSILGQDYIHHMKIPALNQLGESYLFTDYQQSLNYFSRALNAAISLDHSQYIRTIKLNISFLHSYYCIESDFEIQIDDQTSLMNYIFYLIQKGDHSLAQEQLDQINIDVLTEWNKGFYFYYRGLLSDNIKLFYQSAEAFDTIEHYFYLQLPLIELQRLGENEEALKIISKKRGSTYEENFNYRIHK